MMSLDTVSEHIPDVYGVKAARVFLILFARPLLTNRPYFQSRCFEAVAFVMPFCSCSRCARYLFK